MKNVAFEDSYRAEQSMYDWEDVEVVPNTSFTEIKILHWKEIEINDDFANFCKKYEKQILSIAKNVYNQNGVIFMFKQSTTDTTDGWLKFVLDNWSDEWSISPYSYSFYSSKNIDWGYKPAGSLRISDHWNFESGNTVHCKTNVPRFDGWAVGRYNNGIYEIIKKFN